MATFTAIKNTTQSRGAMSGVLYYIKRNDKTLWGGRQLVTGWNCVAQSAYDEMMTTKRQHCKTDGRMFYQFVQSFSPEEKVSPEEVHAIGLELAQRLFPDFEVIVATHVDTDHLHSHLLVNSVSYADGHKLHQNAADFQRQRQISDEICAAHGLTVLEPPKKRIQEKQMRPGEYRSAVRGESWKFRLINTIDLCMKKAKTPAEFIREMERRGYQVRWEPTHKAITYTTPTGKKCRDDRLQDKKYLKEVMEREFRIREAMLHGRIEEAEYAGRAISPIDAALPHSGAMGRAADPAQHHIPYDNSTEPPAGTDAVKADHLRHERAGGRDNKAALHDTDEHRTGWEAERETLLSAEVETAAHQSQPRSAAYTGHCAGVLGDVVELGYAVERNQDAAPMTDSTTIRKNTDSKALKKQRAKKTALGHKPDDRESESIYEQKMY
ncbi:MAG: relaxase/mobilization nuclease domain-containing protein [Butyricicoccus sp.]|nr:relaxase/mobilization nuclease domain-containing protein [Butyricicoccus sp.]